MVVKCELHFLDNPIGIYFAGQTVQGRVELHLDEPKKIRGICLKIIGFAKANWNETESLTSLSIRKDVSKKTYEADEEYFSHAIYLGTPPVDEGYILPTGTHSYEFNFDLPHDLPSSFEGIFGCIRYTIKAILERPWKFDLKYRLIFTVLKQSDLNYDAPDLRLPVKIEQTKYFWFWPCKSGPFWMSITLPITGFVPGQMIPIAIELDNESNVNIHKINFQLQKIIKYKSTEPTEKVRTEKRLVVSKESNGVSSYEKKQFQHSLLIPSIPPSSNSLCSVIQITYALEIQIRAPGIHKTDKLRIPITVGTVPLSAENLLGMNTLFPGSVSGLSEPEPEPQLRRTNEAGTELLPVRPPAYSEINPLPPDEFLNFPTPPSYEESVYGIVHVGIREPDDQENVIQTRAYVPRYPVYSFYSPETSSTAKPRISQGEAGTSTRADQWADERRYYRSILS